MALMSNKEIEIQSGFFASIIYVFLRTTNLIQKYLGEMFWWLFVIPGLGLSKRMSAKEYIPPHRTEEDPKSFVVLDLLEWTHRVLWRYLSIAFKINSKIHGIVKDNDFYERLLAWNKKIPLLGYYDDKTTFTIELLSEYTNEEKTRRSCDFTWLLTHKYQGKFQIIHREIIKSNNDEEVAIKCVWTSGEEKGKIFLIQPFNFDRGKDNIPSAIYYPPRIVIFFFELFISASAVLAFLQLTKDGFNILKNLIIEFYNWAIDLFI